MMKDGYTITVASDIDRDGLAYELHEPSGETVLEIFRHDSEGGVFTLDAPSPVSIPFEVFEWFLGKARDEFV